MVTLQGVIRLCPEGREGEGDWRWGGGGGGWMEG